MPVRKLARARLRTSPSVEVLNDCQPPDSEARDVGEHGQSKQIRIERHARVAVVHLEHLVWLELTSRMRANITASSTSRRASGSSSTDEIVAVIAVPQRREPLEPASLRRHVLSALNPPYRRTQGGKHCLKG